MNQFHVVYAFTVAVLLLASLHPMMVDIDHSEFSERIPDFIH